MERTTQVDEPWGVDADGDKATGEGNLAAKQMADAANKGKTVQGASPKYKPMVSEALPGDQVVVGGVEKCPFTQKSPSTKRGPERVQAPSKKLWRRGHHRSTR